MSISFKEATPDEVPLIREMARRVWPETFKDILSAEQIHYMLEWMYGDQQLHTEITQQHIHYDLMLLDNETAGYMAYGPGKDHADLKLHKLYIMPEFQHRGLGRLAFDRVMALAASKKKAFIILQVNRNNSQAVSAYRKYGFRVRTEAVTDIGNGFVMDDYLLECPVSEP